MALISAWLRALKFTAARVAEIPQGVDFLEHLGQLDEGLIGRAIDLND